MPHERLWNWQQEDWPRFRYDSRELVGLEGEFLRQSGVFSGAIRHVEQDDKQQLVIELISEEALNTSEIEGEILNRDSLQSSLRRHFGLTTDNRTIPPAERGIAQVMVELYRRFNAPLTHEVLFHWHQMLMLGRRDLRNVGCYRTDEHPMRVVSGSIHAPKVHFEAPPSKSVPQEMRHFVPQASHRRNK